VALWLYYEPVSRQTFELGPYLASIFLIQTWIPHLNPMFPGNGPSWTLSCEMFFYLCFPLIIGLLAKRRPRHLVLVVVGLVVAALAWRIYAEQVMPYSQWSWSLRTPIFRIWEFILGIVLALLMRRGTRVRGTLSGVAALLAAWVLVYFNVRPHLPPGMADTVVYLDQVVAPLLSAWLLAVAARRDLSGRRSWLASKPMVLLGLWSFAFYLVHYIPLRLATVAFGPRPVDNANVFDFIGMAAVGVALAASFYYLVEHPAERRLRNLFSRPRAHGDEPRESEIERAGEEALARLR
jgi:peptidoglycan/LPS O-acetylase OafA/YrhL